MNRELLQIAARQYGVFTARQSDGCGLSRSTLHDHVRSGGLLRFHAGVYGFAGSPPTWERSLKAAVLAGGEGAAVSHRAGGRLWELTSSKDDTLEITVPAARRPRLVGVTVHRSGDLARHHISWWKGFPVTKPARTILDLGAVLPPAEVEDALDRALTRRLITIAGVEWILTELARHGRHGSGVVGRILDERALGREPADGLLEPRMARVLENAGLPAAVFQHPVHDAAGRFLAEVDFAYPELRLAIEVDGFETHGTPRAMSRDFVRQNGLVPYGWRVLRFTWAQVVNEPEYVGTTIGRTVTALAA